MAPRDLTRSYQTTLAHLRPPPKKGGKYGMPIPTHFKPPGKSFVQPKDRIPFWNIAPGDKVKLVKGGEDVRGRVGTVEQVWRESNRVSLKEDVFKRKKRTPANYPGEHLSSGFTTPDATMFVPRSYHVSNLRLQWYGAAVPSSSSSSSSDNLDLEDAPASADGKTVKRIARGAISWDRRLRKWHWTRYGLVEGEEEWVELDWPKRDKPVVYSPGKLDQTSTISLSSTWIPTLSSLAAHATPHQQAIKDILPTVESAAELKISPIDLGGGIYSRAARQKKWTEEKLKAEEAKRGERKVMVQKGRVSSKQVRREAEILLEVE